MIHAAYWLLGAVMSITVQTKNSVTITGQVPEEVTASYQCTYQKGDIRANDTASLVLNGWQGETADSIVLHMRSNKSAGAGTITVYTDGTGAVQQSGTYAHWVGRYDTELHPICLRIDRQVEQQLRVDIVGLTNSLHIASYDLYWTAAPERAYSVTLYSPNGHTDIVDEHTIGSGILLPGAERVEGWYHVGWSETDIAHTGTMPDIHLAGTVYHPRRDCELWAVYCNRYMGDIRSVTTLETGYYLLMNTLLNCLLADAQHPADGIQIVTQAADSDSTGTYLPYAAVRPECVYRIDVDTLRQRCTLRHTQSNRYVGVTNGHLANTPTEWEYTHNADGTYTLSHVEEGYRYVLHYDGDYDTVRLLKIPFTPDVMAANMWTLFAVADPAEPTYWSTQPEPLALDGTRAPSAEIWTQVGIWKMRIIDGKKQIYLHK